MTDGINRISGGNSYSYGGFVPSKKEDVPQGDLPPATVNHEQTQVDPSKVMEFMAKHNYFVAPAANATVTTPVELDPAAKDRIAGYMEKFEMIYGIVQEEFGEELAPTVMNFVMDYLMGVAA